MLQSYGEIAAIVNRTKLHDLLHKTTNSTKKQWKNKKGLSEGCVLSNCIIMEIDIFSSHMLIELPSYICLRILKLNLLGLQLSCKRVQVCPIAKAKSILINSYRNEVRQIPHINLNGKPIGFQHQNLISLISHCNTSFQHYRLPYCHTCTVMTTVITLKNYSLVNKSRGSLCCTNLIKVGS